MSVNPENIIVNSCEFTPVYIIPSPGFSQAGSYVLTSHNQPEQKPISDNLKSFYENSGNIDNSPIRLDTTSKPRILKKQHGAIGKNIKLSNILMANGNNNKVIVSNNAPVKLLQPVATSSTPTVTTLKNAVPKVCIDRKIVKVDNINKFLKKSTHNVIPPKLLPKESNVTVTKVSNNTTNTKLTSVQLLKLGETYRTLNTLSDDQMQIVSKALKIFHNPEKVPTTPAYDPATNTHFIYKIVSPKDLTVVGKNNKIVIKEPVGQVKKEVNVRRIEKKQLKKQRLLPEKEEEEIEEIKVTRSGRKVKFPKQILPEETLHKPRKKNGNLVSCFQCSAEFNGLYRLQKHYENHPTHIPAKVHSNLFHCLLTIIKSGAQEDRANIFIHQLEQLIEKLKSLLPCLLKKIDGTEGNACTINDDIGRLFDMNAGNYNLNMDALTCVKDKDGCCIHNPTKATSLDHSELGNSSQIWKNEQTDSLEADDEVCARINSVDKWPITGKRLMKIKLQQTQQNHANNAKKFRLTSENSDTHIDLDELIEDNCNANNDIKILTSSPPHFDLAKAESLIFGEDSNDINSKTVQPTEVELKRENVPVIQTEKFTGVQPSHTTQFHSTHFDIRSSPIKSSASFRKFQINPGNMQSFQVQLIRPLGLNDTNILETGDPGIPTTVQNVQLQVQNNELELKDSMFLKSEEVLLHLPDEMMLPETREMPMQPHVGIVQSQPTDMLLHTPPQEIVIGQPPHVLHSDPGNSTQLFRDHINLQCKDSNITFNNTKDWTIGTASSNVQSHDNFMKSSSLIESELLQDSEDKSVNIVGDQSHDLAVTDNSLLSNQGNSVLNFLDSLGSDCLTYSETDRSNTVDFQLDLFSKYLGEN